MYDFNYHKPQTVKDALSLFKEADDGIYLAGGHTLIPAMKVRCVHRRMSLICPV